MKKLFLFSICLLFFVSLSIASDIDGQSLFLYYELPKGTTVAITISAPTPFYINNSTNPVTLLNQNYVIPRSVNIMGYDISISTQTTYISIYGKLK